MNNITTDQGDRTQKIQRQKIPSALLQSGFDPDPDSDFDPDRCKFSLTQRRKYLIEIEIGIAIEIEKPFNNCTPGAQPCFSSQSSQQRGVWRCRLPTALPTAAGNHLDT
jgi:hypothetical protein